MDAYALEHFPEAVKVVSRLREKGHEAYFAGGYFRDRFLGRRPNDVDVATSAEPGQVQAIFTRTVPVGVQFGVIKAVFGDEHVEIATFREDEGYTDGRRPTGVKFSGPEADARRRDFTINGVFWDPVTEKSLDFVGGEEDLEKGVVRAIGDPDARFDEDRLRILRAPRFAGRLGFRIDAATAAPAREGGDGRLRRAHPGGAREDAPRPRARALARARPLARSRARRAPAARPGGARSRRARPRRAPPAEARAAARLGRAARWDRREGGGRAPRRAPRVE